MDEPERMEIEWACARLVDRYVQALDIGPTSDAAVLFTDDGIFEEPTHTVRGRQALDAHFGPGGPPDSTPTRHVVTNLVVDAQGGDRAEGRSYLCYYAPDAGEVDPTLPVPVGPPSMMGVYHDRFVRTPDGWRFAHKRVEVTHVSPGLLGLYRQVVLGEGPA